MQYEIAYFDVVFACSILCMANVPAIETWWSESREVILLYPSREIAWPVEFTY